MIDMKLGKDYSNTCGMEEHLLKEYSTLAFTLVYTLNTFVVQ